MKKSLLIGIASILLIASSARAQPDKEHVYWGGTIGLNGTSDKYNVTNGTESGYSRSNVISPEFQYGYFFNNSIVVGLGLKYNVQLYKATYNLTGQEIKGSNQSVQLLPFVRKYMVLNDRWSIFIHGEIGSGYNWNKNKARNDIYLNYDGHYWQHNLSIKPGLVYHFPRNKWAIEGYANVLALNARYLPLISSRVKEFTLESGLTTNFPTYFTVRVARYISPVKK